ncbi:MAG: ComEC/Rec2 family competence protein [Bacteroidales bacterium]|nr:ComEC/Rec2 family competence protein [Bacteroidales bacterium]
MKPPPPTLRLLLPLMVGIMLGKVIPISPILLLIGLATVVVVSFFCSGNGFPRQNRGFPLCANLFFVILGCLICQRQLQTDTLPPLEQGTSYAGIVLEPPHPTKQTLRCTVRTHNHIYTLYFVKDSLSAPPAMGDRILFRQQARHGKSFVPKQHWKRIGVAPLTIRQKALRVRERIIGRYAQWGFSSANLPIISALTVGHKGALTPEQRDEFAHAGIAHVLALSGLHIGFIWILLQCVLWPLRSHPALRWLKWALATASMVAFALVAGLAPSVVRAVLMCTLMEFSLLCGRRALSVNTISLSALIMLCYNPLHLFDVGFQLSFLAVTSIVTFVPWAYRRLRPSNLFLRWMCSNVVVGIAAQAGTAPLAMHYFHYFSPYFLLANLVAALLVPLILYGVLACVLFHGVAPIPACLVGVVDTLATLLRQAAGTVSRLPLSSLDTGDTGWLQTMFIYLTFVSLVAHLRSRRPIHFILFLSFLTGLSISILIKVQ